MMMGCWSVQASWVCLVCCTAGVQLICAWPLPLGCSPKSWKALVLSPTWPPAIFLGAGICTPSTESAPTATAVARGARLILTSRQSGATICTFNSGLLQLRTVKGQGRIGTGCGREWG